MIVSLKELLRTDINCRSEVSSSGIMQDSMELYEFGTGPICLFYFIANWNRLMDALNYPQIKIRTSVAAERLIGYFMYINYIAVTSSGALRTTQLDLTSSWIIHARQMSASDLTSLSLCL